MASSRLYGWHEGVRVYGPRGMDGRRLSASDLDACSGHTHKLRIRGRLVRVYHYHRLSRHARVGCPQAAAAPVSGPASPGPAPRVAVSATPGLFPAFDPATSDYTVRCDGSPVNIGVYAEPGAAVSVDGAAPEGGSFSTQVAIAPEQAFDFVISAGGTDRAYHVRCLPTDFPAWDYTQLAPSSHDLYTVSPIPLAGSPTGDYVIIFDEHGVPVWWYKPAIPPVDSKVLTDGSIAWARNNLSGYELHLPDGTLTRLVPFVGGGTDPHDLQEVGNGDLMLESYQLREHVDTSAFGGSADATVIDAELEQIDPSGSVVWTWKSKDHIALAETGRWWPEIVAGAQPYDIIHINSNEPAGGTVIISARHTDAVYGIDRSSGDISWKLGGTTTPQSLTVLNDPESPAPGAQHDARLLPDGTLTVHDNGTNLGRAPRAVRYRLDLAARTATLIESVSDPEAPTSFCCGSARRSSDGSWVMNWGGRSLMTEFAPGGGRAFLLRLPTISYRGVPITAGLISDPALRAGMTAMHPR